MPVCNSNRVSEHRYLHHGVEQARRDWLEPQDVLNARTWDDLRKLLKRG
jgi:hypothetical protein